MKIVKRIPLILFILSLLYYVFCIGYAVYCAFKGIDSGWAMPAMSSHEPDYGFDAFASGIAIGILYTVMYLWFIPVYQIVFLIAAAIVKLKKKKEG